MIYPIDTFLDANDFFHDIDALFEFPLRGLFLTFFPKISHLVVSCVSFSRRRESINNIFNKKLHFDSCALTIESKHEGSYELNKMFIDHETRAFLIVSMYYNTSSFDFLCFLGISSPDFIKVS